MMDRQIIDYSFCLELHLDGVSHRATS